MFKICKQAGVPIPIFEEIGDTFSVTIPLKETTPTIIYETKIQSKVQKLTERQNKILDALKDGPLSRKQIMMKIKTKLTERTIQLELARLNQLELIKPEGKAKFIVWSLIAIAKRSRNDREIIPK